MSRFSTVTTNHDAAGDYEVETFDRENPKCVIVCSHGRGVRRWDGKNFFYAVADHYKDAAILLADQYQHDQNTIVLNPVPILVERVQRLITTAKQLHPDAPVVIIGHSFGCGVATFLDLSDVGAVVFVTPTAGQPLKGCVERFGKDVMGGKLVRNHEGAKVNFTPEFVASLQGVVWPERYRGLVKKFAPTYVFEAGGDEVIGDERFELRDIPFTKYFILEGAQHNLTGRPLADFFSKLDPLL